MSRTRLLVSITFALALIVAAETTVLAAGSLKSGGPVKSVTTATANSITYIESTSAVDVNGLSVNVPVASGEQALLVITVSISGIVYGGSALTDSTFVLVTVDGQNTQPGSAPFASTGSGGTGDSNSMQWISGPVAAGSHTVKVRAYVDGSATSWQIGARTLTVLRSKVS